VPRYALQVGWLLRVGLLVILARRDVGGHLYAMFAPADLRPSVRQA
jgi:hypothetical protein